MLLAGKKVVVVGGSSGIGLATAEMAKREYQLKESHSIEEAEMRHAVKVDRRRTAKQRITEALKRKT